VSGPGKAGSPWLLRASCVVSCVACVALFMLSASQAGDLSAERARATVLEARLKEAESSLTLQEQVKACRRELEAVSQALGVRALGPAPGESGWEPGKENF